jgi:Fic family protein
MAHQDLSLRYTLDQYATKAEVAKGLGTSMIDGIWQNILQYRALFVIPLPLQSIDKHNLYFHLTPTLLEKVNVFERKMTKVLGFFSSMQTLTTIPQAFNPLLISSLTPLAKHYGASTALRNLTAIIEGKKEERNQELLFVERYFSSLTLLAKRRQTRIDEELFGDLLVNLMGHDNLDSFYREKELTNRPRSIVSKVYESAPFSMIESMMNSLINYVNQATISPTIISIIAFYYLNYVKPFDLYNDELSFLVMKNILIHCDFEIAPLFLAIETCIEHETFELKMLEVQKTSDITYLIDYLVPLLDQSISTVLDHIVSLDRSLLIKERTVQPTIHTPTTTHTVIAPPSFTSSSNGIEHTNAEIEANKLVEYLLHTHIDMKYLEAFFYSRHCQEGKFYTIAQFKQKMGCAYETARTSMDHLVKLGYYRKEPYKNKYVYSPLTTQGEPDDTK